MGPVDVLLSLLPMVMVAAVIAVPLGAGAILGGLLNLAAGGGALSENAYSHEFEVHRRWVDQRLRQRYLARQAAEVAREGSPITPAFAAYRREAADSVRAAPPQLVADATNHVAARGPARIGPVAPAVRASAARAAAPRLRASRRGPRASASGRARKPGRSSTSSRHPTPR